MKKLTILFTFIALLSSNSVMALTAQEQKIAHEVIEACQTLDKCTKALIDEKLKNANYTNHHFNLFFLCCFQIIYALSLSL